MVARKKPKPTTRMQRARAAVNAHPGITWGTLAAIVGVFGVIAPGIYWTVNYFETRANAQRNYSWLLFNQMDTRELVIGKWVTDCQIALQKTGQSVLAAEVAACNDYAAKLATVKTRAEDAHKAAMELSR